MVAAAHAAGPTVSIQATTPQIQENFKDIGGFTLTRTGSTDTALKVFLDFSTSQLNVVNPSTSSNLYISGPLCPLNTIIPGNTAIAYLVTSLADVDRTVRTDCATQTEAANAPAGATPIRVLTLPQGHKGYVAEYNWTPGTQPASTSNIAVVNIDGLAVPGRDYVPMAHQATFSIGQRSTLVPVIPMQDDDAGDPDASHIEQLTVTVTPPRPSRPTGYYTQYTPATGAGNATISIVNGPDIGTGAGDPFAAPGQGGLGDGTLTISRIGNAPGSQDVFVTVGGTAPADSYTLSDADGNTLTPGKNFTYKALALGMPSGYISGPFYDPTKGSPQGRQPLLYLVANKGDALPADGCACQLPSHRIPIYLPGLPQVAGSSTGGVENFSFKVSPGDAFGGGDTVATFDIPTVKVTIPAPASGTPNAPTSTTLTVTPNSAAPTVSTAAVTAMFLPLNAPRSGYLSGPLAGPNSPPAVGKPVAYLVATPADVLAPDADTPPANATPIKMVQFGGGTSAGAATSFTLERQIGDYIDITSNPEIALLQVPVNPAADAGDSLPETTDITSPATGYLSGPLIDPANPPAAGKAIGYVVAAAADVVPVDSKVIPTGATPIPMAQVSSGGAGEFTMSFLKNIGDPLQSGETVAKYVVPETATDAALEGSSVYIANGTVSPIIDITANQQGINRRLVTVGGGPVKISAWMMSLNGASAVCYDWSATAASLNPPQNSCLADNTFSFNPSNITPGAYPVRITVTDSNNQTTEASLLINVKSKLDNLDQDPEATTITSPVSGYLSGPLLDPTRFPAINKPIGYIVAAPADVLPSGSASAPTNGTAIGVGSYISSEDSIKFLKNVGDSVQSGDTVATVASSPSAREDIRDSDGDYIPDVMEGYADTDNDGIPDYLDSNMLPVNVLQEVRLNASAFLITADPGLTLSLGDVAFAAGADAADVTFDDFSKYGATGGAGLLNSDVPLSQQCIANPSGTQAPGNPLPQDMSPPSCYPPYVFQDFDIGRIPQAGGVAHVVIPQQYALPINPHYLVFHPGKGWQEFVYDDKNTIKGCCDNLAENNAGNKGNYPGSNGNCPPPGSSAYSTSLKTLAQEELDQGQTQGQKRVYKGYMCLEVTIQDGGPNDTDGVANHTVTDPAVVASAPRTAAQVSAGGGELVPAGAGSLAPLTLGGLIGLLFVTARRRAGRPSGR